MPFDASRVTCAWVEERIDAFLDGDDGGLAHAERDAVETHAATCPACAREVAMAARVLAGLRAFPNHPVPASVLAAAERAIAEPPRIVAAPAPARSRFRIVDWLPATLAAAALVALVATARWSPAPTPRADLAGAGVAEAARETVLALSYLNRYARMTGEIVTDEILEKHLVGTVERTLDNEVFDGSIVPPLRRAVEKSGIVETKPPHERS
ncbi:MAG TPA: zf-HC2 domain-containing protein [Candidatus Krumholzibacteria bacterium]|nr:zf-HC2 domain-containing protein [Candidatus Krumholzibacteria bacterium]